MFNLQNYEKNSNSRKLFSKFSFLGAKNMPKLLEMTNWQIK